MTEIEAVATSICNYFMQNCEARIAKKDFNYIINTINMHLLDGAEEKLTPNPK